MDFDLTEDQKEIKRVARELLAARSLVGARARGGRGRRAYDDALWDELVRARLARHRGAPRSTAARGSARSSWRCCWRSSATRARRRRSSRPPPPRAAIQACGTDEQRARWLPALGVRRGDGRHRHARAVRRRRRRRGARAARRPSGEAMLVDASAERRAARDDRPDAPLRDRRAAATASRSARRRRRRGRGDRVRAAIAAEVVGVAQRALEMTLAYVKERRQFGVPVGSFQAVAHRCAQMLLDTESARSTAYFAAWAADADARAAARGGGAGGRGRGRRRPRR